MNDLDTVSLAELATVLSAQKGISLADAQAAVFVAARANAGAPLPSELEPPPGVVAGSGEHLSALLRAPAARPVAGQAEDAVLPSLSQLAIGLSEQTGIPLADAQAIVFAAANKAQAERG